MTDPEKTLPAFPPVRSLDGMLCVIAQLRAQHEAIFAGMESYAHAVFAARDLSNTHPNGEESRLVREACDYEYANLGDCEAFGALAEALGVPEEDDEPEKEGGTDDD